MSAPSPILAPWPYPRWIAHRGAGKLAPENTLTAFRLGAQHGYRMFECDAKLSADGVPFLMHDATLDRTTNGAQALGSAASAVGGDHPWAALSQLDAGAWHSRSYAGEPLPTLENIAHYCIANGFLLNIEIKPTPGVEEKTGQVVGEHAARLWHGQAVLPLFSSFRPEALAGARATAPHTRHALGRAVNPSPPQASATVEPASPGQGWCPPSEGRRAAPQGVSPASRPTFSPPRPSVASRTPGISRSPPSPETPGRPPGSPCGCAHRASAAPGRRPR